jgi:hypothetical protein
VRARGGRGRDGGRCMKMRKLPFATGKQQCRRNFSNRHRGAFCFVFRSKLFSLVRCMLVC